MEGITHLIQVRSALRFQKCQFCYLTNFCEILNAEKVFVATLSFFYDVQTGLTILSKKFYQPISINEDKNVVKTNIEKFIYLFKTL